MDIQWEEPPPTAKRKGQHPGRYVEFAVALRQHPNRWAVLPGDEKRTEKGASATAQNIRRGVTKGFTKDEYDTAVDGTKIYVCYTGPADPGKSKNAEDEPPADEPEEPDEDDEYEAPATAPEIRAWALARGLQVPERGRLPQWVIDAFHADDEEEEPEPWQPPTTGLP